MSEKDDDEQMSKLFWVIRASLVAVLLYVALDAILTPFQLDTALAPRAVSGDERPHDETMAVAQTQAPPDYSVIIDNDMFTESDQAPEPGSVSAQSVVVDALPSAEKLGLKLRGVVAGGPVTSRAIIEDVTAKVTLPYKIGDRVTSATIESIEPDRVVLLHGGRKVALQMHVGTSPANQEPAGPPETPARVTKEPATVDPQLPQPSARLGYVEELFRKATIEPYVRDGRTEGLRITGLEETPLTKLFGLRDGDVVQTVNGQNLNSKQKAFQVLKKARTQPQIDLKLLRDGKAKELSFDL